MRTKFATFLTLLLALLGSSWPGTAAAAEAVTRVSVRQSSGTPGGVVTFGQVFAPGDVTGTVAAQAGGNLLPTQVDVRRRHPDGSVRHAVLSVELPGTTELSLVPVASAPPGAFLSMDEALAGGFDALVEVTLDGKTYSARAAEALRAGAERWLAGPLVTEYLARSPLTAADGTSLAALLVTFDARFYSPGAARVSVTFENAWHDAPGNLTYDVRISVPGATVLDQPGVLHYHHARWRQAFDWGAVPRFDVIPDPAYLISAAAIPRYDLARRRVPASAIDALVTRWQSRNLAILGNGLITPHMGDPGGRMDIGPLPTWTVLALLSGDPRAFAVMYDTADRAGSFSTHYRDRGTGRAYSIDVHPTVSLANGNNSQSADKLPACSTCSSPYQPDAQHQPSLVYLPYLLTGDLYYLEELYFWANWNFIKMNFSNREREKGLAKGEQPARAQAWSLRTLGHAAWAAPDADPERPYFLAKLANNLAWYASNAPAANSIGAWGKSTFSLTEYPAEVGWHTRPWQVDFLTLVMDHLIEAGYPDATPSRDWLARYVVGRHQNLPLANADPYDLTGGDDFGNWYEDWATIERLTPFSGEDYHPNWTNHYQAMSRAALTAAIRAGLPGAQEHYDIMDRACEEYANRYDSDPTWSIVPSAGTQPPPPPPPPAPPAAPSALVAQAASSTEIRLTWQDNATDEDSFHVERLAGGTFQEIRVLGANATTTLVTGLSAGTTYTFRVRARSSGGFSGYSNQASATTDAPPPTPPPATPAAPTNLAAKANSSTSIRLTWRDNSGDETAFHVEQQVGGTFQEIRTVGANTTSVVIAGLAPKTSYTFRVRASNAGGFSAYSNTATAGTRGGSAAQALAAPDSLTATSRFPRQVRLSWRDRSQGEHRFRIEVSSGGPFRPVMEVLANTTSALVTPLSPGTTYTFRVRAAARSGESSAYSNTARVTTPKTRR